MSAIPPHAARRQAAYLPELVGALAAAVAAGRPADRALAGVLRTHREFGGRDRRFFSGMVFAWFRWRGWLPGAAGITPANLTVAGLLDGMAPHPALDLLARDAGLSAPVPELIGLTLAARAAQLRQYLNLPAVPDPGALLPDWAAASLLYPADVPSAGHLCACLESFQTRPAVWVRVDAHPPGRPPVLPTGARPHPAIAMAVELPAALPPDFNPVFVRGLEVQDLASQITGLICAPRPGERWWDVCAGAGGKTLHLADLLGGAGEVYATDIRPAMLAQLQKRRAKHAPAGIHCRPWRGKPAERPAGLFDGVLVDAPCSGLGTWNRNPDARWRAHARDIAARAADQARLLDLAAEKVRPGGRLVYAVCTLTARETVGVADEFTAAHPAFAPEPFAHPLTGAVAAGAITIWPWQGNCSGMFIARWRHA